MKLAPFELERWLAQWDTVPHVVDIAASGVEALSLWQLLELANADVHDLMELRLDYGDTRGSERLRSMIADTYVAVRPDDVLVTCGAIEALFLLLTELLEPGDEVIVPTPGYQQFASVAESVGATVVSWPIDDHGYDVYELEYLLSPSTKMVVVNTPHNPTGVVLGEGDARRLYAMAERNGSWLLCDEVSRWLDWSSSKVTVPGRDLGPLAISVGGVSKSLGLPGLRIGWIVASDEVVQRCWSRRDYVSLAPGTLDDALAVLALGVRGQLVSRAKRTVSLNLMTVGPWAERRWDMVTWIPPQGGVASVLRYDSRIGPSSQVVASLAARHGVLMAPGSAFGMEYALRLGVGASPPVLAEGLQRLSSGLCALREKEGLIHE